jgi:hypothetical protein
MELILIFFVGIIAGVINSLIGGGAGLLTIPILILTGLPPNVSVATNKLGYFGEAVSSIYNFNNHKKIEYKYVVWLSIITVFGSVIGSNILIRIDEKLLSKIIGFVLIVMLPLTFTKLGLKKKKKKYERLGYLGYFFNSIYDGFYGVGAGILSVYLFISMFGLTYVESIATERIPWLINTTISIIIFAIFGLIDYKIGIVLMVGSLIGDISVLI